MKKYKIISTVSIMMMLMSYPSFTVNAQELGDKDWKMLGISVAKGELETKEFKVGALKGQFTAIKFKVNEAALEIKELVVHFANGEKQKVFLLLKNFSAGTESRQIELKNGKRFVKKVVFKYKRKKDKGKKPAVVLWGKVAEK